MSARARAGRARRRVTASPLAPALLAAGTLLAACGSPAPPSATGTAGGTPVTAAPAPATSAGATSAAVARSAPTTVSSTQATTVRPATSTPLPTPSYVPGTRPGGSLATLGPVERLVLAPLPQGALAPGTASAPGELAPDGVDVAFREFGSGPDLVLLAGEHASMSSWGSRLLAALGADFTVVTPDLPGSGYSGGAGGVRDAGQEADLVAALCAALGLDRPTVLGWGLGGQVALAMAERHPGIAGRLVLADTSGGGRGSVRPAAAVAAVLASPTSTNVDIATVLFPPTATGSQAQWLQGVGQLPTDDLTAASVVQQAALERAAMRDGSLARGLERVDIPALVVVGSLDEVFPPANAGALVRSLPHARELVFPGAGYASIVQDEPEFLVALEKFAGLGGG